MAMSEFYGGTDDAAARETLEEALTLGVTLFDTADTYGQSPARGDCPWRRSRSRGCTSKPPSTA
ncbi:hypothetical protein QMK17_09980 [Rhodococcus sp. G-MC3]|uniref:hypothetical protein n=1 Tax=Rhodococcus sp. G-MC3 TaxID=3046209 RepID=UPI0024BB4782|nr:hypothetical protein [Rhodococcus sp. G-MC3]MDJ0393657.1 hypothetical protein [Rhodococcus sp. G-MC3]